MKTKPVANDLKTWSEIKVAVYGTKGALRRDRLKSSLESFKIGLLLKKCS
jgi:hypothetical protein